MSTIIFTMSKINSDHSVLGMEYWVLSMGDWVLSIEYGMGTGEEDGKNSIGKSRG